MLAFILLIINASYTANLAASLTDSLKPKLSAQSVASTAKLCSKNGAYQARFDATYPLASPTVVTGTSDAAIALRSGVECDGLVASRSNYDAWRVDADNCLFKVSEVIFVDKGGWMTNRESSCVLNALEWGLGELEYNGTIDSFYRQYMPVVQCAGETAVVDTLESTGTTSERRQLTSREEHSRSRRRLKGAAEGAVTSSDESSAMTVLDFVGVFSLWGLASLAVLGFTLIPKVISHCKRNRKVDVTEEDGNRERVGIKRGDTMKTLGISADDENAMLRELLSQMRGLQSDVTALKKQNNESEPAEMALTQVVP